MNLNLNIHQQALFLREKRSAVLANNLINEETPNYKSRDFEFKNSLNFELNHNQQNLSRTNAKHLTEAKKPNLDLKYRMPNQPSIDGNTVESEVESTLFTQNSLGFQTSFTLLNNRFIAINKALKGE